MLTASGDAGELVLRSTRGRIILAASVGASAMASLDATVVNVALPHIGGDLDADVTGLQWVLTGYLLGLSSFILLAGALGDRLGRRRIFVIGTAWFAGASLVCGLAPSVEVLVATRILQGVGGALLTPGSLAILQASFREADRAVAVGAWSALGGVAGAIGPFLGGTLVDGPGWRWVFLVNVPISVLVVLCAATAIPESRDEHATGKLDSRGVALSVVGLAAGTWALTEAGARGWDDTGVVAALIVGALTMAGFVAHLRRAANPLVPPQLFRNRTFTVVNLGTLLLYAGIGLTFFLVAYELQVAAGWSALDAGLALLPTTVLMLLLSARSGGLAQRIGPRLQLTVGPIITGAGVLLLTRIDAETTWVTDVLPGSLVLGIGLVTFVAPLTATVMASTDPGHVSTGSGVNNAVARGAGLAGLAVIPVIAALPTASGADEITDAVRTALVIAAALAAAAGVVMSIGLAPRVRSARTVRPVHCAVEGPPIQPDPELCPLLNP
ncbi:MAG: DHA2 family efflux MFS transporter permease subunit [Actinomycetota bacterium]